MKVKSLFKQNEKPTLNEYICRCNDTCMIHDVDEYINPTGAAIESYQHYNSITQGVEMLEGAIERARNGKDIVLICDSDCDGYCATTIAYQFLVSEGVEDNNIKVLFHSKKQHGFSQDIIIQLNKIDLQNVGLIWVPDAGTNDVEQTAYFNQGFEIPILITDHHEPNGENDFATIINNQCSDKVENKNLCGAGVTHKLITAYCHKHNSKFHQKVIDLVALATIGDVMDLRAVENRMIIKWGLSHIRNSFIKELHKNFISSGDVTPTAFGWSVIPKINAVCRSDDQELKSKLFYALATDSYDEELIKEISKCHEYQRKQTSELYEKALNGGHIGNNVKIFEIENTPYTGLVAMKLSSHYKCPCMVVHKSNNQMIGSLRSPCNMRTKLIESDLMTLCAGHEASCGVGWLQKNTDKLSEYCEELDVAPNEQTVMYSTNSVLIDNEIFSIVEDGKDIWGAGIPEPTIHISDIHINGQDIKELGRNKTTIKFLYGDISFLMFFASKECKKELNVGEDVNMDIEIIGTPTINEFREKRTKQVIIKEWEVR